MKKFDVFLSHSAEDRSWTTKLASSLKKQGVSVWFDEEQLGLGTDVLKAIEKGISQSKVVVTVIDPKTTSGSREFFEAGMALGLGKEVSFIVPKETRRSDLSVFDVSKDNVFFRSTPEATARQLIAKNKLTSDE